MPYPSQVRPHVLVPFLLLNACSAQATPNRASAAAVARRQATPAASASEADSADAAAVVATMRRVYDGFITHDATAINAAVPASGMIYVDPAGVVRVTSPAGTEEMVKACTVRRYDMDSVHTSIPAPDIALLTFRLTIDESCGEQKTPNPVYVLSAWQRHGGTWRATAFSATPAAGAR